ncbi:MAG: hypothetical protein ACRDJ5_00915 [Actinomycetota bacterium]
MGKWSTPVTRGDVEIVAIDGHPTPQEERALAHAVDQIVLTDRQARMPSMWLRAGRAQGRRLGMYDYRDRLDAADIWRLSARFPPGGREYVGLAGRGDAR